MKKKIIAIIIVILAVIGTGAVLKPLVSDPTSSFEEANKRLIMYTQTLSFPSGEKKVFDRSFNKEDKRTALDALYNAVEVQTKDEGVNAFVTSIDNIKADDSKKEFWALYVNGKQAEVGAGSYVLKNNDTIEWKIETY